MTPSKTLKQLWVFYQKKVLNCIRPVKISFLVILSSIVYTQSPIAQTINHVSIGVKGGYDQPLFNMPYNHLEYTGGSYLGAHMDYRFANRWGLRLDYSRIQTTPDIQIPNQIFDILGGAIATSSNGIDLLRQNIAFGPTYTFGAGTTKLAMGLLGGYSLLDGGDALVYDSGLSDVYLVNTGFDTGALSGKFDLDLELKLSPNLRLTIGAYYLRHFSVEFDDLLDVGPPSGIWSIFHGESDFAQTPMPYTLSGNPDLIVANNPDSRGCTDLSSIGGYLGLAYVFGKKNKETEPACNNCACPDDQHKVIVTVRDEISQKVIPDADVAIRNLIGEIVATGTTNSYGVVDFGAIDHGNYSVTGQVYGISTTTAAIVDSEFEEGKIVRKEVLYTDLRFILKGNVVNKMTRAPEPNTIVSLTNNQTGNVNQDNSDGGGGFAFRLDQNSSYQVVGNKANKLSDIEGVSTLGLVRSATLFVNLELGVDDFDCNTIAILDIKYAYDKSDLSKTAKFELERLVRYMKDHQSAMIELSSHTDSRGSSDYNYGLSDRRANSAVTYIISRGIARSKIIAQGYGETRLRNDCADGVNCSDEDHRINRRTEAKLICKY